LLSSASRLLIQGEAIELDGILPGYLRLFILRDRLPVEHAGDRLMPTMLPIGLLAIEPEGFEQILR
jgi:hypothetical protein